MNNSSTPQSAPHPNTPLADGPARVQRALDAKQAGQRVQIHAALTNTAAAAAAAAGCEPGQIVKSMLFLADGKPVLLLIAGDRKADTSKVALLLGVPRKRIKLASAEEVLLLTGFEVGGVSPVGHPRPLETLIDSALGRFEVVYAAAGSAHAVFASDLAVLQRLTGGRVGNISA